MKAWIISDLHSSRLDLFHPRPLDVPDADICICAGDISDDIERSVDYLFAQISPYMPVVATMGNHDFYGSSIDRAFKYATKWTSGTNVHILEDSEFRKENLRIIGATLWSDFEIKAHDAGHLPLEARREVAIRACSRSMRDFYEIYQSGERGDGDIGLVSANELIARHRKSRTYIDRQLAEPFDGSTLVLTHHAPLPRSLDPRFDGHLTNAAFASDLRKLIKKRKPLFWVHGHVHCFQDYVEAETRVLCNPRGYHIERGSGGFRPGLVIETNPSVEAA